MSFYISSTNTYVIYATTLFVVSQMSLAASDERRVQRFFVFFGQVLAATGWSTKFTSKSFSSRICWQNSGLSHGHTLDLQAVRSEHKITRKLNIFSRKRKVLAQSEPVRLWAALRRARWDKLLLSFICTASENKVIQVARKFSNRYISILQKKRARLPTEVKVNQANIDRFEFRGRTHLQMMNSDLTFPIMIWVNLTHYHPLFLWSVTQCVFVAASSVILFGSS